MRGFLSDQVSAVRAFWRRTLPLYIGLSLLCGFSWYGVHESQRAQQRICRQSQSSWDANVKVAEILTKPTELSPEVRKLFPPAQTETLRLQIRQANSLRERQHVELDSLNGGRPRC